MDARWQMNGWRLSAVFFLFGVALLLVAFTQAAAIPRQAHDDFAALVRAHGGGMSHSATYPDTYRQMSANRRMLQNAYLGGSGLVLFTLGCVGLMRSAGSPVEEAFD